METGRPLEGVRVVELATYLAGPGCGRILAHLGAEVIKVESPMGDPWRHMGGLYAMPNDDGVNPLFILGNAYKKYVTLNLKSHAGREAMDKLLSRADIFITNLLDKTLNKLGLAYDKMHEKYPKLVYGRIMGYGEKGDEAVRAGFDATAYFARGGLMLDYVEPGTPPNNFMMGAGDMFSAQALAAGVMGALLGAELHGEGTKVVTSLLHAAIWNSSMSFVLKQYGGEPYADKAYRCKDGTYMLIHAATREQREAVCRATGLSIEEYGDRRKAAEKLTAVFASKTFTEWERLLGGIPTERLKHVWEVPLDGQSLINGFLLPYHGAGESSVNIATPAMQYEGMPDGLEWDIRRHRDTEDVLRELGYDGQAIQSMAEDGDITILQ